MSQEHKESYTKLDRKVCKRAVMTTPYAKLVSNLSPGDVVNDEHSFDWVGLEDLGEALSYGHYKPVYRSGDEPHVLTFKNKEGQNIQ